MKNELNMIIEGTYGKIASWLAFSLSVSSFIGWVQLSVGVLSSLWLLMQIVNYLSFTLPANIERARIRKGTGCSPGDKSPETGTKTNEE